MRLVWMVRSGCTIHAGNGGQTHCSPGGESVTVDSVAEDVADGYRGVGRGEKRFQAFLWHLVFTTHVP